MFERPHHRAIAAVLQALDADLLARAACYFGGGTASALALGEYRESRDIDFLCADLAGYRLLRNRVVEDIGPLILRRPAKYIRYRIFLWTGRAKDGFTAARGNDR